MAYQCCILCIRLALVEEGFKAASGALEKK